MSTKTQKRITKQVRLSEGLLIELKHMAVDQGTTYSALADKAVLMLLNANLEKSEKI